MAILPVRLIGTTIADGSATVLSEAAYVGKLFAVAWVDGDFTDGIDAVLSVTQTDGGVDYTLLTLTNADNDAMYYPRVVVHSEAGAALTGTSGGDRAQPIVNGRLKLAITSGGASHTGGAIVYLEV
jgi:hypothetical protein